MGENNTDIPDVGSRPSIEITSNNIVLLCENCSQILPEGIISLRPRKEARFVCVRCIKLSFDKINDIKKAGNLGNLSNQGRSS